MEDGGGSTRDEKIDDPSRLPPTALEAGGSSGGPASTISSATKRKRPHVLNHRKKLKSPTNSQLKRPAELIEQKQPAPKRFKPPMAGKKLKSPVVTKSPVVVTGSPMMRLVVSPVVMGPRSPTVHFLRSSPAVHSSPSSPAIHNPPSSPAIHNLRSSPAVERSPSFDQQTRPTTDPGSTSTQIQPRIRAHVTSWLAGSCRHPPYLLAFACSAQQEQAGSEAMIAGSCRECNL